MCPQAANSVSPVSARPQQYFPVPAGAGCCHRPSSGTKDMLHNSARAQGRRRLFYSNSKASRFTKKPAGNAKQDGPPSLATAINMHEKAVAKKHREKMLQGLGNLKTLAEDQEFYEDECNAKDILLAVMSPLQYYKHGGLDDDVVKESLGVALVLLENAPKEIRIVLCNCEHVNLKPILDGIIQDYGWSAADHEVIKVANEILAKLPSTPK